MCAAAVAFHALIVCSFGTAFAQAAPPPPQSRPSVFGTGVLRLFLDCQYECDTEFIRKELTIVDHVRDSQSADIHALVTTESTGGGGSSWTVQFIGRGRFEGYSELVKFSTPSTDSSDQRRRTLLKWLKAGLATPAALASGKADFDVVMPKVDAATPAETPDDPWNSWVFNISTNGFMDGEESASFGNYSFRAGATRVTDKWKWSFSGNWNNNTSRFELEDEPELKTSRSSWGSTAYAVKSLGNQFSAAARLNVTGSTFSNYKYNARLMAGVEYDFFPYSESTRRSLTVSYLIGPTRYSFEEVTIFDKLEESKIEHSLGTSLGLRQRWGSVGVDSSFNQHLDDLSKNRLNVNGFADVRLFKGFSFNVGGGYSRIRDQINLKKGDVPEAEVLLRLQQLATGYSYFMHFGVTYRFGSIFNNVVNPRFQNFF